MDIRQLHEVILSDVPVKKIREKVLAFATLIGDDHSMLVAVSGAFRDKSEEIVFLNRGYYEMDIISLSNRKYFRVHFDTDWSEITPENGVFAYVKFMAK